MRQELRAYRASIAVRMTAARSNTTKDNSANLQEMDVEADGKHEARGND